MSSASRIPFPGKAAVFEEIQALANDNHAAHISDPMSALTVLAGICLFLAVICLIWFSTHQSRSQPNKNPVEDVKLQDTYHKFEPLKDFDWRTTAPLRLRPWKPKYHLTMGLETITLADLIAVDQTYLERLEIRRALIDSQGESVLAHNAVAHPAILELHSWIFETYLPQRYPSMYSTSKKDSTLTTLQNKVTQESIHLPAESASIALRELGSHIDTDFLFLLPSSQNEDGQPIYHLEAYMTCFPAGFSTRSKLSKPLAEIHTPVPGYAAKLGKSMDRFFAKVQCGTIVKRANWSISTHGRLFAESGSHFHSAASEDAIEKERQAVNIDDCRLRCERQTLHRLPRSGALVFAFKTYQYKLSDVKAEGDGEALADAIEGLSQGNVPDMNFYKRGVVWGDKVVAYLRAE